MARRDKLARLVAVFDQFHGVLGEFEEPTARRLAGNWAKLRSRYVDAAGVPRSKLAAGMEQGLRETPMLLASMPAAARKVAADALTAATMAHYPDFVAKDAVRIDKIKARGSIRGESEFHLIRYRVDVLEGATDREEGELQVLYKLIDRFEARGS